MRHRIIIPACPGFTLIEVLLSVSILTLLAGLGLPVYSRFHQKSELQTTATSVSGQLRRASSLAKATDRDSSWGVELQAKASTLFKGASFAGRDATFDERLSLPPSVTIPSGQTIVFAIFTGYPNDSQSKTVALTSSSGETVTITVSRFGTVVVDNPITP